MFNREHYFASKRLAAVCETLSNKTTNLARKPDIPSEIFHTIPQSLQANEWRVP